MEYTDIRFEEVDGEIAVIRIDRPAVRNCIGTRAHAELVHAWTRFRDSATLKVAVLTGTGDRAFCSGADLSEGEKLVPQTPEEVLAHNRGERPGNIGPSRWSDIYKPIVAAVNGVAYAGGLEWACFADIRIAEEHATFGVTCRRWNIGLGDGGTVRLPRIVGQGRALEIILTGRKVPADECLRIGLCDYVTP